jgi:hypothetical protein
MKQTREWKEPVFNPEEKTPVSSRIDLTGPRRKKEQPPPEDENKQPPDQDET